MLYLLLFYVERTANPTPTWDSGFQMSPHPGAAHRDMGRLQCKPWWGFPGSGDSLGLGFCQEGFKQCPRLEELLAVLLCFCKD